VIDFIMTAELLVILYRKVITTLVVPLLELG